MTVQKALKEKAKLINELKDLYLIAKKYNSFDAGNPIRYNVADVLKEIERKTKVLVSLKAAIHTANLPVYDKIFEMSELKSMIKQYSSIETAEGISEGRYGSVPRTLECQIDVVKMTDKIKTLQSKVGELQDFLDNHNAITDVDYKS